MVCLGHLWQYGDPAHDLLNLHPMRSRHHA